VPSGSSVVAEFAAAKVTTVSYQSTSTIGALQFDAGAPTYAFNITSGSALTLAGAGVVNLSTSIPVFNVSGNLFFINSASAANAALVANAGGVIDFSGLTSTSVTAGSIAGAGTYSLGRTNLTVGGLGTSTIVSGSLRDGGKSGGTGASVTKVGAGALTLTGANTYTGATTISGTLEVSGGGQLTGTSGIVIAQNSGDKGTLHVSGAYSKVVTAGLLTVGGAGTGTLTIDNAASVSAGSIALGGVSGGAGTLNIGAGGAAGVLNTSSISNSAGATGAVNLNETDSSYTFSASLNNTLTVNQNGAGTSILTGTNTYSGGTNLNAGTLRVSSNTNLGATTGSVTFNGGTLQLGASITSFSRPVTLNAAGGTIDTGSFSLASTGTFGGVGGLTKVGSGTLLLNGTSSYTGGTTVSGGVLRGTTDSLQGNIVDNANVTFAQATDGNYAGVMSGTGSLIKLSAGNLILAGANTYTGATTVTGGTLTVNGSLRSPVTAGAAGRLSGVGSINGNVNVLGTLAPGNAASLYGTLTVRGDLQLSAGSVLLVNTNADGRNSRVNVTGSANMAGSISVLAGSGNYSANTQYTVLSAGNGLTAAGPTAVTTDLAFLTPTVSSDANNLYVTLTRNSTSFSKVTKMSNERATAGYLDSLAQSAGGAPVAAAGIQGSAAQVLDQITQMTAAQARNSFSQLAGSDLTRLSRVSQVNTSRLLTMLDDHLSDAATPGADPGAPQFKANEADLYAQSRGMALAASAVQGGLWARSLSTRGSETSRASIAADETPARVDWFGDGLALGFDQWVAPNVLVGAVASYTSSHADLNSTHTSQGTVRTPQVTVYGGLTDGQLGVRAMFGYAHDFYDSERVLTFGSATSRTTAFHGANELSAYTETNYTLGLGDYRLQPLVGLRYIGVGEGAYSENGGIGSLAVDARQTHSLASDVGFRLSRPLPAALNGGVELRTVWTHDYIAQLAQMTARLAGDSSGNSFNADGGAAERNALLVGASVNTRLRGNLSAHFDYNATLRADTGVQQFMTAAVSYVW
jgi:autotransporter-associated beta strand protein